MFIIIIALIVFIYFILDTIFVDYIKHKKSRQMVLYEINSILKKESAHLHQILEQYNSRFQCELCQGKEASVNIISMHSNEIRYNATTKPHKFIMVSCKQCSDSQLYNLNFRYKIDHYDLIKPKNIMDQKYLEQAKTMSCQKCHKKNMSVKRVLLERPWLNSLLTERNEKTLCFTCLSCGLAHLFLEKG